MAEKVQGGSGARQNRRLPGVGSFYWTSISKIKESCRKSFLVLAKGKEGCRLEG